MVKSLTIGKLIAYLIALYLILTILFAFLYNQFYKSDPDKHFYIIKEITVQKKIEREKNLERTLNKLKKDKASYKNEINMFDAELNETKNNEFMLIMTDLLENESNKSAAALLYPRGYRESGGADLNIVITSIKQKIDSTKWEINWVKTKPWGFEDFLYFSITIIIGGSFGDIIPKSTAIRRIVIVQFIICWFILIILGNLLGNYLIKKLDNK